SGFSFGRGTDHILLSNTKGELSTQLSVEMFCN
ncbi:MAG: hypothetical protein ACI9J5_002655, partial [Paraglaciecola sp.]